MNAFLQYLTNDVLKAYCSTA